MAETVQQKLDDGPMFDMAVVEHGFAPYVRDYDVLVDVAAPASDRTRSYVEGRYRYRFTRCVVANVKTVVPDDVWRRSWDDVFTDYKAWEAADHPDGYVWGVCWQDAYPGLTYRENSDRAREWSERLGKPMHEAVIDLNAQKIELVFHDVFITKIAQGNPDTHELTPLADHP